MASKPTERPGRSLRGRLMLALIGPLAILLLIGGVASYGLAQYFADTVYDGWLFDSVNSLALEVEKTPKGPFVDMPAATQRLFEWDVIDKTYFRISGARKGILAGRPDMPHLAGDIDPYQGVFFYDLLDDLGSIFKNKDETYGGALIYDGRLDHHDVRVARLELPERKFGEKVTVEVAETTRKRTALAGVILLSTLIPQVLLTLVAAAAMRRAVRHGLQPLQVIAERLETRSYQELSPLPDSDAPAEVLPLTRSLNNLLGRLGEAQNAQRRFIADAAHQLRTPLTAIKLQVEEAAREDTIESVRPILLSLQQSADRAVRLSNQLLSLARAEPDSSQPKPFKPVDLVQLAQDTGAEWAPRALSSGIEMQFASESEGDPVTILGDPDLLREALGNLLDNAIKYQKAPGAIQLSVTSHPAPSIVVEDAGPGIPPDLRSAMLRRFVRGERGEGTGLGLPITLEIARLHRGELLLESGPANCGLRARLIFPAVGRSARESA